MQRFRGLTGPLTLSLSMLLLLPLLTTACGETSEPEPTGRVVEKEVVREVVVTPETPPGRELAQQAHEGEPYIHSSSTMTSSRCSQDLVPLFLTLAWPTTCCARTPGGRRSRVWTSA